MFTFIVFCATCYIIIKMYSKRNFKLMKMDVWRHPIYESKRYMWFIFKLLLVLRGMYFVLGMKP